MKINLKEFYRFSQRQHKINRYAQRMRDGRKQPQVTAGLIFLVLVHMVAWGQRHFLQMDQLARKKAARRFFRSPRRMVCSDSTIARSLAGWEIKPVRQMLGDLYESQPIQQMQVKVGQRRLRLAAIDGSQMGHFQASGCLILGRAADLFVDAEPIEKQGKELAASQRLLNRLARRFGQGFVDLLLLDGLYLAQGFIRAALKVKIDVAIKTDEEGVLILQQANALFDHRQIFTGVEYVEGFDVQRQCSYQVWASGGFFHTGVPVPLRVARVQEYYPKNKPGEQHRLFYVVTTRQDLSALEMREVGHFRWQVENNGFRALNTLAHTKRVFTHEAHSFLAALLIFFVAFNLIHLFAGQLDPHWLRQEHGGVKVTIPWVCSQLFQSLIASYNESS